MCALLAKLDDDFIQFWHPKYDETEDDEPKYKCLLDMVGSEILTEHTLSKDTFTEILNWKSARVKGRIKWDEFKKYQDVITECLSVPDAEKMNLLVDKLYGFGAPVASTFLQFIYPSAFPIVDRRTVDVLRYFGYIQYKSTGIAQYAAFKAAILKIQEKCPKWNLREIDRALFSFHKQNLELFGTLANPNHRADLPKRC